MPIITPPFRTSLLTQNGVPFGSDNGDIQTTKDWWLYWQQLTDRSNSNSKLATAGTHGDRPMPGSMPDGALYYENDRGVLYANTLGVWQYVAGTMYGTLSPDQRPPDLGTHDAGFEFRGTDVARQFLWSQTAWVEVTAVQYGTHAARINPATIVEGALYVESDRGGVIYQRETPAGTPLWQYLAGTMWGTLSPDQRPTDLGTHDAGFDFRTTTAPPREFIWNQTAWVEITSISGAVNLTHPNVVTKVGSTPGSIVEGGITDASPANSNSVNITAAGRVGIGTAAPNTQLSLIPAVNPATIATANQVTIGESSNNAAYCLSLGFYVNNTLGAFQGVIQANNGGPAAGFLLLNPGGGQVGIGLSPSYQLHLSTDSAGKPGTSTWSVVSDLKLKQNMEPVKDDSLAILNRLDWMRYEYNGKAGTPTGLKAIGLVAQELQRQLPEAVRSTKTKLNETDAGETDVLAIDYHHILVHSARAIQQLDAELKALKTLLAKPLP